LPLAANVQTTSRELRGCFAFFLRSNANSRDRLDTSHEETSRRQEDLDESYTGWTALIALVSAALTTTTTLTDDQQDDIEHRLSALSQRKQTRCKGNVCNFHALLVTFTYAFGTAMLMSCCLTLLASLYAMPDHFMRLVD